MKVLMVHAGNPVPETDILSPETHCQMETLESGRQWFKRQNLVNFELQRQSLVKRGVEVEAVVVTQRRSLASLIPTGLRIRKIAREKNFDIVHALWGSSTSLIVCLFSPVPVIVSICGSDLLGNYNSRGEMTFMGQVSALMTQCSAVVAKGSIVMSRGLKQALWASARRKAEVIPAGIDLSTFFPIPRDEARCTLSVNLEERIVLFFAASGAHVKNRPLAESVFEIVRKQIPGSRLEIVDGVPQEKLKYYYNAADALLLTSFHEGSNNSLKEALACNLPIVSTDCGDAEERLAGVSPGAVVRSFGAADLAAELVRVLKEKERSNGRDHVHEVALDQVAMKIVRFYEEVIGR